MGVVANSYAGKHFTMYQINTSYTSHLHDVTMLRANYISVTGGGGASPDGKTRCRALWMAGL